MPRVLDTCMIFTKDPGYTIVRLNLISRMLAVTYYVILAWYNMPTSLVEDYGILLEVISSIRTPLRKAYAPDEQASSIVAFVIAKHF